MKLIFEMKKTAVRNGNILWNKLHLLQEKDALEVIRVNARNFMQNVWLKPVTVSVILGLTSTECSKNKFNILQSVTVTQSTQTLLKLVTEVSVYVTWKRKEKQKKY
jgi:hypothetical protein